MIHSRVSFNANWTLLWYNGREVIQNKHYFKQSAGSTNENYSHGFTYSGLWAGLQVETAAAMEETEKGSIRHIIDIDIAILRQQLDEASLVITNQPETQKDQCYSLILIM